MLGEIQALKFEKLSTFLLQKEKKLDQTEPLTSSTTESAFSAQFKGKDKQNNASNASKRSKIKCYYHNKPRHFKRDCHKR
jgi:hypothetical protein